MNAKILRVLFPFLLALPPLTTAADSQWVLAQSTLTYHVSHLLHHSDGVSRAATETTTRE